MENLKNKIKNMPLEKQVQLLAKLKKSKSSSKISTIDYSKNFQYEFNSQMAFDFSPRQTEISDPNPDYIQIEAKASSLNFRDVMIASGQYPSSPDVPTNMGSDYAGVIVKVGDNVTDYKVGDEVISLHIGHTEKNNQIRNNCNFIKIFNVHKECVCLKPKNLSFEQSCCIPTVFLTAYIGLIKLGNLDFNEKVLIHTASGGVGLSAIEFAKWKNANIITTAGTEEKREFLRGLGIENVYNSRDTGFAHEVKNSNLSGIDLVLNTLDGERMFESIKLLKPFGRFIHIDKKDIASNTQLGMQIFDKGIVFQFLDISLLFLNPKLLHSSLVELVELFENESIEPIYFTEYSIKDLKKAITALSRGTHIGKIIVKFD